VYCLTPLVKKRFRMTRARLARVHILAQKKGLIVGRDDELYRLRLQDIGVASSKDFKQADYVQFIRDVRRLPDASSYR